MPKRRRPQESDIPHGRWFPDRGDRVFVPCFDAMGVVIEICPLLVPGEVTAKAIYYLVEMEPKGTRSLFTAPQLLSGRWVGSVSLSPAGDDEAPPSAADRTPSE